MQQNGKTINGRRGVARVRTYVSNKYFFLCGDLCAVTNDIKKIGYMILHTIAALPHP
jgi:hypothetical protein